MTKPLEWMVGWCREPNDEPAEFVPARVPGAVQLDWAAAHDWPDYTYGDNTRPTGGWKTSIWLYRATLLPDADLGTAAVFRPAWAWITAFRCVWTARSCMIRKGCSRRLNWT